MLEIHSETVENLLVYFIKDTIYRNNFKRLLNPLLIINETFYHIILETITIIYEI